jgi:hypothetical protein
MQFNLDRLRDTIFGEFLKCAMLSDPTNLGRYDQSNLDLELTLDGDVLNFQMLFTMFEARLRAMANSPVDGPLLDEIIQRVSTAVTAAEDLESHQVAVNCDLSDVVTEVRKLSMRLCDLVDSRCNHKSSVGVTDHLGLALKSLRSMREE